METYDYREAVQNDIRDWLSTEVIKLYLSRDDMYEDLYEQMWASDRVTGNASGSYTFNAWQAEEFLCHNFDLLRDAFSEFGYDNEHIFEPEFCDLTIRCYLLGECLSNVLEEDDWYERYVCEEDEVEELDDDDLDFYIEDIDALLA